MKIKYNHISKQFSNLTPILKKIEKTISDGYYTGGKPVLDFEKDFAKLIKAKYAIGTGSGTDAIKLILKGYNIGCKDEVITAPNTFIGTIGAIAETGATPVFIDVNKSCNINPDLLEKAITKNTKAVLAVHLYGNPANIEVIKEIANPKGIKVIEDACQAIGAKSGKKYIGTLADAAAFSLHPPKTLCVWGDGGVITTNDKDLANKIKLLRNHGRNNKGEAKILGTNSRLDSIQAVIGSHFLPEIAKINKIRIKNASFFDKKLSFLPQICLPTRQKGEVYFEYVIFAKQRDKLFEYLNVCGIEVKKPLKTPVYRQKAITDIFDNTPRLKETEKQQKETIYLPCHQFLSIEEMEYIINCIKEFYF